MKHVLSKISTNVFSSKKIVLYKIIQVISKYFVVNLNVEHETDILPSNFISKMFSPGPGFDKWMMR